MAGYLKVRDETDSEVYTLLDVSANTTGSAFTPTRKERTYQVLITGTATVAIQVSNDGTNWYAIRTVTADDYSSTAEPWFQVRAVSSGMSAATAKVYMGT